MRRRSFLVALSGAAAWPMMAQAQSRPYRIGFLSQQPGQSSQFSRTFVEALRELGYVEGQNITIEWRLTPDGVARRTGGAAGLSCQVWVDRRRQATTFLLPGPQVDRSGVRD